MGGMAHTERGDDVGEAARGTGSELVREHAPTHPLDRVANRPGHVYRGHVFHIAGSPRVQDADAHLVAITDGAVAVGADGRIAWVGQWRDLPVEYASWRVTRAGFVLPGFVDAHAHFPQTYSQAAHGGGQLLEWLEQCIFPAEARLADPAFAELVAHDFVARRIATGTTAAMVFGSAFPAAQDALYRTSLAAGLRTVSGRGIQTVGPPAAAPLITSERDAVDLTAREIARWHGSGSDGRSALVQVAIVPRFSLSTTAHTLAALGELYASVKDQGVYVHTHLSENNRAGTGEIAAVLGTYGVERYLDTYDGRFLPGSRRGGESLLGRRTIMAHAVHCHDDELARMRDAGTSVAHCPTSQLFLGSGTMPWRRTVRSGVTVAMGTDVGAGDEWSIPGVLAASYGVHLSEPGEESVAIAPAELLFSGTLAGARALDCEGVFGNLDVGKDADLVLVDPTRVHALDMTLRYGIRADDEATAQRQTLFALLLGLHEAAISGVVVRGRRLEPAVDPAVGLAESGAA